jgi:6-phosphogluconate dehydrogenase
MQIGMIGLGRMGSNMVRRLMRAGHSLVVFDRSSDAVNALVAEGATGSRSFADLVARLSKPRVLCVMVPVAAVDALLDELVPHLQPQDTVIDGGNSHFQDDIARHARLTARGIRYVDMGTSGGVWGLERGFCLMIGGDQDVVERLDPMFAALSPGGASAASTSAGMTSADTAARGYLHCGPPGAGHFVKMIHNAIEYGLMAAYAEGFNILEHANAGKSSVEHDAETTPLRHPEHYRYDFDMASIAEVWRHGSVISSWLLDLTASAFAKKGSLDSFAGRVSDSGEGRWALAAANDVSAPAPVLATALFQRFASRGEADFQNRVLSAMRWGFGGHAEKS